VFCELKNEEKDKKIRHKAKRIQSKKVRQQTNEESRCGESPSSLERSTSSPNRPALFNNLVTKDTGIAFFATTFRKRLPSFASVRHIRETFAHLARSLIPKYEKISSSTSVDKLEKPSSPPKRTPGSSNDDDEEDDVNEVDDDGEDMR